MNPERRFWVQAGLMVTGVLAVLGGTAAAFYVFHRVLLEPGTELKLAGYLGGARVGVVALLAFGLRSWYRRYVVAMHRLTEDVEALVYGSHLARLPESHEDPTGIEPLLNALMERYRQSEAQIEERLANALGEATEQKSQLESLLDALSEAVVVFSPERRIIRTNHTAHTLLDEFGALEQGQSMEILVNPSILDYAMETLQEQMSTRVGHPHVDFLCDPDGSLSGRRARIAPLVVYGGRLKGYILTIEPESAALQAEAPPLSPRESVTPMAVNQADLTTLSLGRARYVVLDTETTGLNPAEGDQVISLGAVLVAGGRIIHKEFFETLVDPGRRIHKSASRVHGLTDEDVQGQQTLAEIMPQFIRFAGGSVLVAHNAAFDLSFLGQAARAAGEELPPLVLDTMLLSAILHPHQPSHSLDSLLIRYGIGIHDRHTALGDALMTAELLLKLIPQLETRGIRTVGEAARASRGTPLAKLSYR